MDLSDIWSMVVRRKWLVLTGLIVCALLGYGANVAVPVTYDASASVLLLPPRIITDTGGNPFLALGGLATAAAVLGRAMNTDEVAREVRAVSPTAKFGVTPDAATAGPVLAINVVDATPQGAIKSMERILQIIAPRFQAMQTEAGAPTKTLISLTTLDQDAIAKPNQKARIRAVLAAVGIGLGVTMFIVAALDRLRGSRRPRGSRRRERHAKQQLDQPKE